jgi:ABC-type polysaccharide/polyol phosphate export permease
MMNMDDPSSQASSTTIYDNSRHRSLALEELRSLLRYKDLIVQLIRRDIVTRYKRSVLGILWTMLNPLGTMVVLAIVFSRVFEMRGTYPAYILTNLIAWNFFAQTTSASLNAMLWGSTLFQRIYLPRTSFVVATIGTGIVNTLLAFIPLVVIFLASRVPLTVNVLLMPVALLLLAAFALGISLVLSTFVVFFPDIAEVYPILLSAWLYLSPIIIPEQILAKILNGWLLWLNPLFPILKVFRLVVYDGLLPTQTEWGLAALVSILTLIIGWVFFTRKSKAFAYHV